jgi:hypothetical protein
MATKSTVPEPLKTTLVTTRLEQDAAEELARRAALADRTIAAELRRAVRFYLSDESAGRAA